MNIGKLNFHQQVETQSAFVLLHDVADEGQARKQEPEQHQAFNLIFGETIDVYRYIEVGLPIGPAPEI